MMEAIGPILWLLMFAFVMLFFILPLTLALGVRPGRKSKDEGVKRGLRYVLPISKSGKKNE